MQRLMYTIEDLDRMDDESLNFEMLYRDLPCTEQTTRDGNIQCLRLHHLLPSIPTPDIARMWKPLPTTQPVWIPKTTAPTPTSSSTTAVQRRLVHPSG